MIEVPRESVELLKVNVLVDGDPVADYDVAVTSAGERPTDWAAPTVAGDVRGYLVDGLEPGTYWLWARYAANPEHPVVLAGLFRVT